MFVAHLWDCTKVVSLDLQRFRADPRSISLLKPDSCRRADCCVDDSYMCTQCGRFWYTEGLRIREFNSVKLDITRLCIAVLACTG
jgi:hypothetical protein